MLLFKLLSLVCILLPTLISSSELLENKIRSFLTIRHYAGAVKEAEAAHAASPEQRSIHKMLILSYAHQGLHTKMFSSWNEYMHRYSDAYLDRELLEAMGWSVIFQADDSSKPLTRAVALVAASFTNHHHGVQLIKKGMQDRNAFIRALSAKLAGNLHDRILKEEVFRLAFKDPSKEVRIEALNSLGKMEVPKAQAYLEKLISAPAVDEKERFAAIVALVQMLDTLSRERMEVLIHSTSKGDKLLACRAAIFLSLKRDADLLFILLNDPASSVRCAALEALGILHAVDKEKIRPLLQDPHPAVAIYAAWVMTLHGETGHFNPLLSLSDPSWRRLAAGALAYSGDVPTMESALQHEDKYVRWNAAYGLIGSRSHLPEASQALHETLQENKKLMWQESDFFRYLAPSKHHHQADYPNYPQIVDHMVRLELLQTLAYLNDPQSHAMMVNFLGKCVKELQGVGMTLLLTEGDEEGVELVRSCLEDKNVQVRISAALLLSLWGKDPAALQALYDAYSSVSRPFKEMILEALGRVGDPGSLPFLVEQMNSSSSNLKLIAASSLLLTLRK